VTGPSPDRTAGVSFGLQILSVDDGYNLVATNGGQVRWTTTDPQVSTPAYGAFVNGSSSFTVIMKTANNGYRFTTDTAGALTAVQSSAFNVVPNTLSTLYANGPAGAGAGICSAALSVSTGDAYNNILSVPSTVTVNLGGGGAGAFYLTPTCTGGTVTSVQIPASA